MKRFLLAVLLLTMCFYTFSAKIDKKDVNVKGSISISNDYLSLELNEGGGDENWVYKYDVSNNYTSDACYSEFFALYSEDFGDVKIMKSDENMQIDQAFDLQETSEKYTATCILSISGKIKIEKTVVLKKGAYKYFDITYKVTNITTDTTFTGLKFFQVVDYDIGGADNDYGWYNSSNDYLYQNDDNYFRNGFSGSIHSTEHGMGYYSSNNADCEDGSLNGLDKYPESGTDDVGLSMGWLIGDFAPGATWELTVHFAFGGAAGIEANAGPDQTVKVGQTVTLDGSASESVGTIVSYDWDLDNDGEFDDASGAVVTTTFNEVGDYRVWLKVTDDAGRTDVDDAIIHVIADNDLTVTDVTYSPQENLKDGQIITVSGKLKNLGSDPINKGFTLSVYVNNDFADSKFYYTFPSNGEEDFSFNVKVVAPQTTIKITADLYDNVKELNEDNNQVELTISDIPRADLSISNVSLSPQEIYDGTYVNFNVTISNTGEGDTLQGFYVSLWNGNSYLRRYYVEDGLSLNENKEISFSYRVSPGDYNFILKVDDNGYSGNITESDETNNVYTLSQTVSVPKSDLVISNVTFSPDTNIAEGDTVTFNATVHNNGSPTLRTFRASLYIDDSYVDSKTIEGIGSDDISVELKWLAEAGTHTAKVVVDSDNSVVESDESNNEFVPQPNLPEVLTPNLIVSSVSYTPQDLIAGVLTTFSVKVKNDGSGPTVKTFYVTLFVDDSVVSSKAVQGIAKDEEKTVIFNWYAQSGDHVVKIKVDSDDNVVESNEDDNEYSLNLPHIDAVDLAVSDLSYQGDLKIGAEIDISAKVKNLESAKYVGDFVVCLYADDHIIKSFPFSSIDENAEISIYYRYTLNSVISNLKVVVDPDNKVIETNENNNEQSIALGQFSMADFVPMNLSFSPENPKPGETVTFSFDVKNIGDAEALKDFRVQVYLDNESVGGLTIKGGLLADESVHVEIPWNAVSGSYTTLKVLVDTGNVIPESNEDNNELTQNINLNVESPDFTITQLSYSPTTDLKPGDDLTITAVVKNLGINFAQGVKCAFYVNDNYIGDEIVQGPFNTDEEKTISHTYTLPILSSPPTLKAVIDYDNSIHESNEDNNSYQIATDITTPLPDLTISEITWTPNENIKDKDLVKFNIKIQNNQNIPIPGEFTVRLFIGNMNYDFHINSMSSSESVVSFNWIAAPGEFPISAVVDVNDTISETDENNNSFEATDKITVAPKENFYIEISPSYQKIGAGGKAAFTLAVENNGSTPIHYSISPGQIDSHLTMSELPQTLYLSPQERKEFAFEVFASFSTPDLTTSIVIEVTSLDTNTTKQATCTLEVEHLPKVYNLIPTSGTKLSLNSVGISFSTLVNSYAKVYLRKINENDFVEYDDDAYSTNHIFSINNLEYGMTYVFKVKTFNDAGEYWTDEKTFETPTVGGVAFTQREYSFTVKRDYNQQFEIVVENKDIKPHQFEVTLEGVPDDFIVNFMGYGSTDAPAYVSSGSRYNVKLVAHLQDATQEDYTIYAKLKTLDEDDFEDVVPLKFHVLKPGLNLKLEEISSNDVNLQKRYKLTNLGDTITDLNFSFDDSVKNTMYIDPDISHMYLEQGQSIEFTVVPILSSDEFQTRFAIAKKLRSQGKDNFEKLTPEEIKLLSVEGSMNFYGNGDKFTQNIAIVVPVNKNLYRIVKRKVVHVKKIYTWFCTNRPNVELVYTTSEEIKKEKVINDPIYINFTPHAGAQPFDLTILVNGYKVKELKNVLPSGTMRFDLPLEYLNFPEKGVAQNRILIHSVHANPAHYIVGADINVHMNLSEYDQYVVATSESEAESLADANMPQTIKPTPEDLSVNSITITPKYKVSKSDLQSNIVRIGQPVEISVASASGMEVYATFSNGDPTVYFYETSSGVYKGIWYPSNPGDENGNCTITVTAKGTEKYGQSTTTVQIQSANSLSVIISDPEEGFIAKKGDVLEVNAYAIDQDGNMVPYSQVALSGTITLVSKEGTKVLPISFSPGPDNIFHASVTLTSYGDATIEVVANDLTPAHLPPAKATTHGKVYKYGFNLYATKDGYKPSELIEVVTDSDNETFKGIVKDAVTNKPIKNAKVIVKETGTFTFTDNNGNYAFYLGRGDDDGRPVVANFSIRRDVQLLVEIQKPHLVANGSNTTSISVTLVDSSGKSVSNENVKITLMKNLGSLDRNSGVTNASGNVMFNYTVPEQNALGNEDKVDVPLFVECPELGVNKTEIITLYPIMSYILKIEKPGFKKIGPFEVQVEFVDGIIKGKIISDYQDRPVAYAKVVNIGESGGKWFTDENGMFTIQVGAGGSETVDLGTKILPMQTGYIKSKLRLIMRMQAIRPGKYYNETAASNFVEEYQEKICECTYEEAEDYVDSIRRLGLSEVFIKGYDSYYEDCTGYFVGGMKNIINFAISKLSLLERVLKKFGAVGENEELKKKAAEQVQKTLDSLKDALAKVTEKIDVGTLSGEGAENLADFIIGMVENFCLNLPQGQLELTFYQKDLFSIDVYFVNAITDFFYRSAAQKQINNCASLSSNLTLVGTYDEVSKKSRVLFLDVSDKYMGMINTEGWIAMLRVISDSVNQVVKLVKIFDVEPNTRTALEVIDKVSEILTVGFDVGAAVVGANTMGVVKSAMEDLDDVIYYNISVRTTHVSKILEKLKSEKSPLLFNLSAERKDFEIKSLDDSFASYNNMLNNLKTYLSNDDYDAVKNYMQTLYSKEDSLYEDLMKVHSLILGSKEDLEQTVSDFDDIFAQYSQTLFVDNEARSNLLLYLALYLSAPDDRILVAQKTTEYIDKILDYNSQLQSKCDEMLDLINQNNASIISIPKIVSFDSPSYLDENQQFSITYKVYNPSENDVTYTFKLVSPDNVSFSSSTLEQTIPAKSSLNLTFNGTYTPSSKKYSKVTLKIINDDLILNTFDLFLEGKDTNPPVITALLPKEGDVIKDNKFYICTRIRDVEEKLNVDSITVKFDNSEIVSTSIGNVSDNYGKLYDNTLVYLYDNPDLSIGTHTITVTAKDIFGNVAEKTITFIYQPYQNQGVSLEDETENIVELSAIPQLLLRDDEGNLPDSVISFRTLESGILTATIVNSEHSVEKTFISDEQTQPKYWEFVWDGKNDDGNFLQNGEYQLEVTLNTDRGVENKTLPIYVGDDKLYITNVIVNDSEITRRDQSLNLSFYSSKNGFVSYEVYSGTEINSENLVYEKENIPMSPGINVIAYNLINSDGEFISPGNYIITAKFYSNFETYELPQPLEFKVLSAAQVVSASPEYLLKGKTNRVVMEISDFAMADGEVEINSEISGIEFNNITVVDDTHLQFDVVVSDSAPDGNIPMRISCYNDYVDTNILKIYHNSDAIIYENIPDRLMAGQNFTVQISVKNTGTKPWIADDNYRWAALNLSDVFTPAGYIPLPSDLTINPGEVWTFTYQMTAPDTPGNYQIIWSMEEVKPESVILDESKIDRFGEELSREIVVSDPNSLPDYDAKFIYSNIPDSILINTTFHAVVIFENTGKTTWTFEDDIYLGAVNDSDDIVPPVYWRIALSQPIPYGAKVEFHFDIVGNELGEYITDWRMLKERAFWFGETFSKNVKIVNSTSVEKDIWQLLQ